MLKASNDNVKLLIRKQTEQMPLITSLIMVDGALPGEAKRQEMCDCDCGLQNDAGPTILGGVHAREGAWPWNAGENQFVI